MHVVKITPDERKADKFTVKFENDAELKVNAAAIADFGLYSGREMSEDEYEEVRQALELRFSKTRALRIAGSRNISSGEMQRRLIKKGDSEQTARESVKWLEEMHIIDDGEYAKSIVRHYTSKGYGPAKVRDELYRRGIERETLEEAMSLIERDEEAVYAFIEKKLMGSYEKKELRKVTDSLYRRGFSYDDARSAVNSYLERAAEDRTGDFDEWE